MNLPPAVDPPATVSTAAPNVNIGKQARRLIEIRHQMNNGLNISHILDIMVTKIDSMLLEFVAKSKLVYGMLIG